MSVDEILNDIVDYTFSDKSVEVTLCDPQKYLRVGILDQRLDVVLAGKSYTFVQMRKSQDNLMLYFETSS